MQTRHHRRADFAHNMIGGEVCWEVPAGRMLSHNRDSVSADTIGLVLWASVLLSPYCRTYVMYVLVSFQNRGLLSTGFRNKSRKGDTVTTGL
jgi:hypothetical protein